MAIRSKYVCYRFACYEYYSPYDADKKAAINVIYETVPLTIQGKTEDYLFRFFIYKEENDGWVQTLDKNGKVILVPVYKTTSQIWDDEEDVWAEYRNEYYTSLKLGKDENMKKLLKYGLSSQGAIIDWIHNEFPSIVQSMDLN